MTFIECRRYRAGECLGDAHDYVAFKLEDVMFFESVWQPRVDDTVAEMCRVHLQGRKEPLTVWLTWPHVQEILKGHVGYSDGVRT